MSGYGRCASCHALRTGDEQGIAERAGDHDPVEPRELVGGEVVVGDHEGGRCLASVEMGQIGLTSNLVCPISAEPIQFEGRLMHQLKEGT